MRKEGTPHEKTDIHAAGSGPCAEPCRLRRRGIQLCSSSAASSEAVPEAASEAASSEEAKELSTTDALRIAGLKGPTTMGLVNLLSMEEDGTASMDYDLQLYGAAMDWIVSPPFSTTYSTPNVLTATA